MTTNDNKIEWHYSIDGSRFGPVDEENIITLLKEGKISDQALVWNSSMPEWKPIVDSQLAPILRNPKVPPPLSGNHVSNGIVWTLAFAPLIGTILEGMFSEISGVAEESLWFVTLAMNIVLSIMDEKKLEKAGYDTSKMGSSWLVPVYLYKRAKILKQNKAYFFVWCLLFAIMIFS